MRIEPPPSEAWAIGTMPADKKARKNFIKEEMARRFPHLKVTLGVADALGILTWARTQPI